MAGYMLRRAVWSFFALYVLLTVVFFLVKLSGDPALLMLQGTAASEEDLAALRAQLGLDKPLFSQYCRYFRGLFMGDWGTSLFYHAPVKSVIFARYPATIKLAMFSIAIAILVSLPIGILSAVKQGTLVDQFGTLLAVLGQSVPSFWLGIMLIFLFGVYLDWLPTSGTGDIRHFILPGITLAFFPLARLTRVTRSSVLEVLRETYIDTARSKGLSEVRVLLTHVLRNAALPIITMSGLLLAETLGGSVIIETVFSWPGIGRLVVQAVGARDLAIVQAIAMIVGVTYLLCNFAVDILYSVLDPRIAYD